jgi:hypothetical protein
LPLDFCLLIFGCPIPFTSTRRHTILPAEVPSARRHGTINLSQADKHSEKHLPAKSSSASQPEAYAPRAQARPKTNTQRASSSDVTCEAHQDDYGLTKKSTTTLCETL